MVQLHQKAGLRMESEIENKEKRSERCINDNIDVLMEILKKLDGGSLGVAACVCRLWRAATRNDSLWENLCFRQATPPPTEAVKSVVVALGGYKRLYMVCVRPVLNRLGRFRRMKGNWVDGCGGLDESEPARRVWSRHAVQLALSLFCVEYYERMSISGDGGSGKVGGGDPSAPLSPMFLCKAVNV